VIVLAVRHFRPLPEEGRTGVDVEVDVSLGKTSEIIVEELGERGLSRWVVSSFLTVPILFLAGSAEGHSEEVFTH
jgi:hypothetical protein